MQLFAKLTNKCDYVNRSNEEYGSWFEGWSFSVDDVWSKTKHGVDVDPYDLAVSIGDKVWSLVIRFSDGDSFGQANNKGELVWLFSTEESAKRAQDEYQACIDNKDLSAKITIELAGGVFQTITVDNLATGGSSSLEYFDIDEHIVKE
jgi:hypothetical protein